MSDKLYDSVLVGWAEAPDYNDNQELLSWRVRLKDTELQDMLKKYATRKDEEGQGGNVYLKLFMSKGGKACCSVWDPNSEVAKQKREAKKAAQPVADDLPF